MNTPRLLSAVMVFFLAETIAQSANKTWTGAASTTDWFTDGNWNPAGVPGTNDAVFISSGTVSATGTVTVASVTLSGGSCTFDGSATVGVLALSGSANLAGTNVVLVTNLTWTGGSMTGVGQTVVPPGGSLWIDGTAIKYLGQRVLHNQGSAVWTNTGSLNGYYGAVVNNSGTWDTRSDASFLYHGGGSYPPTPVFNNSGSFTKTGGTGTTLFSQTAFNNSGSVSVQKGTLQLGLGGTGNGSFEVATNAILHFSGGTYTGTTGATLTGAGRVRLASGFSFSGSSIDVGILEQTAGSCTLNAPVTVAGAATVNGTGVFGGDFSAGSLTVGGTATFHGTASVGPGSISGSATFNSAADLGAVTLTGSGTLNGPATLSALNLSGVNGVFTGTNVVLVTNLTWTGGSMTGVGQTVVPPGGSLWIDGTAIKYLGQRVLHNQGSAVWTNTGTVYGYYGAVVNNSGTWDTRSDATFAYYPGGSYPPTPVFNNSGSFTKTGGTGTTLFSQTAFNNSGSVSVQKGTLQLGSGGTGNGSFEVATNAILHFSGGTYTGTTGATLTGAGRVRLASGFSFSGSSIDVGILEQTAGSCTLNAPVTVAGAATVNGTGVFGGDFSAGSLTVGGTATFHGTASVGPGSISGSATFNSAADLGAVTLTGSGTLNGPATLSALNLSGVNGVFTGTNVVLVTNLTWTGGSMTGVGQTVVPPGGSLWIDGTAIKYLGQRVLHNQGSAVWTNTGTVYGYYGAVVNNSGTWDTRSDATFAYYPGGSYPPTPVFNNSGSFTKTGGTGTTLFSQTAFNNSGSVSVQKGTLQLGSGGTGNGSFEVATNAILHFSGGTYTGTAGASLTGAGRVRLASGFSFSGSSIDVGILEQTAGSCTLNAPVTVAGAATVNGTGVFGGTFGAGSLTVGGTATFNGPATTGPGSISGSATFNSAADLGAVTLTGSGTLNGPATLSALNLSGVNGVFTGTNVVLVTNLTWTGGSMTGVGQTVVPPGGSLWIDGTAIKYLGQRVLHNQGSAVWTNTGTVYGYYGAVVNNSGTWDTRSDATFAYYPGGSYPPTPVFNNSGSFTKTGGTGTTFFSQTAFNNSGSLDLVSGTLSFQSSQFTQKAGSTKLNGGNIVTSSTLSIQGGSLSGSGTINGNVDNAGELNPGSSFGIITVQGNYTHAGRLNIELGGVTPGSLFDQLIVTGQANLNGPMSVLLRNGYLPNVGDRFQVVSWGTRSGSFSIFGLDLGNGQVLAANYTNNALVLETQSGPVTPGKLILVPSEYGGWQVRLTADTTGQYGIDASTNLLNWTRLLTTNAPLGVIACDDVDAANCRYRFYRAVLVP